MGMYLGSPSKFNRMNEKYPNVTLNTGHEIFVDEEFCRLSYDSNTTCEYYDNFYYDYNKLIHREIIKGNISNVYILCSWIYYHDVSFPWFNSMFGIASKSAHFGMFVLIFLGRWYEERDESTSYDEAIIFIKGSPDEPLKLKFINNIQRMCGCLCVKDVKPIDICDADNYGDDDVFCEKYEELCSKITKLCKEKLLELDIDLNLLKKEFDTATESLKNTK